MANLDKVFCQVYAVHTPILDFVLSEGQLPLHGVGTQLGRPLVLSQFGIHLSHVEKSEGIISLKPVPVKASIDVESKGRGVRETLLRGGLQLHL